MNTEKTLINNESEDGANLSLVMRELQETVEQWQQSKFFLDLQAWKDNWYDLNREPKNQSEENELVENL